jgi:hypothetical protein
MDLHKAVYTVRTIQKEIESVGIEPQEGIRPSSWKVIPYHLYRDTRGYVERVANQANCCYEHGCYEACAVMIRRLMEILIIEVFIKKGIEDTIKDSNGNLFFLEGLIDKLLNEPSIVISRNTKPAYRKLKSLGDRAAHGRMVITPKSKIDDLKNDIFEVTTELLYESGLKRN